MKWIVCVGISLIVAFETHGQTWLKLYLDQIAANQVYIGYLEKGYNIARDGLRFIGNIKNDHFLLDKDFFAGLEIINPKIKGSEKVSDIITYDIGAVKQFKNALQQARQSNLFSSNELTYLQAVFDNLTDGCVEVVDMLTPLITSSALKMSDDERIKRIDALYVDMQDKYDFVNDFCTSLQMQCIQRQIELNDLKLLRNFYGIE